MKCLMRIIALLLFCEEALQAADKEMALTEEIRPDLADEIVEDVLNNIRTVRTYDGKGFVISKVVHTVVGKESKWFYSYDMHGRLVSIIIPDQSKLLYEYPDEKASKPSRIKLYGPDGREREFQ